MACCRITLLRLKPYMFEPSDDDSLRVKQPLASFLSKFKRSEVRWTLELMLQALYTILGWHTCQVRLAAKCSDSLYSWLANVCVGHACCMCRACLLFLLCRLLLLSLLSAKHKVLLDAFSGNLSGTRSIHTLCMWQVAEDVTVPA